VLEKPHCSILQSHHDHRISASREREQGRKLAPQRSHGRRWSRGNDRPANETNGNASNCLDLLLDCYQEGNQKGKALDQEASSSFSLRSWRRMEGKRAREANSL